MPSAFSPFETIVDDSPSSVDETPVPCAAEADEALWITVAACGCQRPGETVTSTRWNSLSSE